MLQEGEIYEWEDGEIRPLFMDATLSAKTAVFIDKLKMSRWFNEDELPFAKSAGDTNLKQFSLTRESEVNILALKCVATEVIIIVYFDVPSRHFGMSLTEKHYSASNRKIMEQLLTSSFNQFALFRKEQGALERKLLDYQDYLKEKVKQVQEKVKTAEMVHQQNREALIMQLFKEIAAQLHIKILLSKEARTALSHQQGEIGQLKNLIDQIVHQLMTLQRHQEMLNIEESDIEWIISEMQRESRPEKEQESVISPVGRLSRTRQLLDRYEEAARIAVYHQEEVNGKNIARYCNPPVTNASISDALKKHKERLVELLQMDKESWPLLRSRFKSLYKLTEAEIGKLHSA